MLFNWRLINNVIICFIFEQEHDGNHRLVEVGRRLRSTQMAAHSPIPAAKSPMFVAMMEHE